MNDTPWGDAIEDETEDDEQRVLAQTARAALFPPSGNSASRDPVEC
jgi:hypothetical protein